jgi:DNA helicase-2/ATP-dependent DNA helicase PcrA
MGASPFPRGFPVAVQKQEQKNLFSGLAPSPAGIEAITAGLNPAQREAVTHGDGPILVIAGAGTGKTRTLVCRLAYLVASGVAPENILLLTFTRKAAEEMVSRAEAMLGQNPVLLGGTFHSVANVLLRRYARLLGYDPGFVITDRGDAEGVVNLLRSSLGLGGSGRRFPSRRMVVNIISRAVNRSLPIGAVIEEQYPHLLEFQGDIETLAGHYRRFKREHQLMDYDDLLVNLRDLLRDFPEAREEISARFTHLLVDEYQDTNPVQDEIVRLIAAPRNNVMVVGDDAQSIYSFRGADFANILRFPETFPDAAVVRLEENYRSFTRILDLGNAVIARAGEGFRKNLFSRLGEGERPRLAALANETAQAAFVAGEIEKLLKQGAPPSEIAVLFRSGFHSYKLEIELASRSIPFDKRGGMKLLESAHIKDVVSYLRLLVNPRDSLSWNRLLLMLPKIGPRTASRVVEAARSAADPFTALEDFPAKAAWREPFLDLLRLLSGIRSAAMGPQAAFAAVMEVYEPLFEQLYADDYPRRKRDLDQLGVLVSGYEDIASFLDDIALDPPESESFADGIAPGSVVLSTVHSAKGLEWDNVFIINLADGRFPSQSASFGPELEEERRLFYVAITRARKRLVLTYPREVKGFGSMAATGGASLFINELDPGLVAVTGPRHGGLARPRGAAAARRAPAPAARDFAVGDRVVHPFFAAGVVVESRGKRKVVVDFDRYGRKELHLDYARLSPE